VPQHITAHAGRPYELTLLVSTVLVCFFFNRPLRSCRKVVMSWYSMTTFRQLRNGQFTANLSPTRESLMKRRFWTEINEKFPFRGHLPPKPQTWRRSNRHHTHSMGCTTEKYCLLHVVVQAPGSLQGQRRTIVVLRGVKVANFPNFGLFSAYKTPKTAGDQPTGQGLHRKTITIFPWEGPKGCLTAASFSGDF